MLYIEHDDDGGCFRLIDDDIGLCTSKSRNVLVRIRDALNAVRETGLVGARVACGADPGVVLAICSGPPQLVVRRANGQLHTWLAADCRIIEPEPPRRDTPSNEPPIGVRTACELLERLLTLTDTTNCAEDYLKGIADLVPDAERFLAARKAAEPIP